MKSSRDVFLTIGKKTYRIATPLDKEDVDRLKTLIDEACGSEFKSTDQEDLLVLTCLRLAYSLDSVSSKIENTILKLDDNM